MKLIDKDALVAEIDKYLKKVEKRLERNNSYSEEGCSAWERDKALYDSYNRTLSFIDTLEVKEPTSEDLEKASEEYAYTNWESDDYHEGASEGKPFDAIGHTQKCFIDGAQWQREQMKETLQMEYEKGRYDMREELMHDDKFLKAIGHTNKKD